MPPDTVYVPETPGQAIDHDDIVVTNAAGGVLLLAANPDRKSALIINVGSDPMRVTTDGSAPTPTHGKPVYGGESLVLNHPFCPVGAVKAIRQSANNTAANASEVI